MSIKTILVPNDGEGPCGNALELAFAAAEKFQAHLEVLHARIDSRSAVPLLGESMSGTMIEEMIGMAEKEGAERLEKARHLFDGIQDRHHLRTAEAPGDAGGAACVRFNVISGMEDDLMARRGRLFDLIVCGKPQSGEDTPAPATLNACLFETGRPVLVAPATVPASFGSRIMVAWNGSTEAAFAIRAAMPFLARADQVYVVSADDERSDAQAADQLAESLAWHGIAAEVVHFSCAGHSVGEGILLQAEKLGADMLVMGAYTHNRLWQMILGGVTSQALESSKLPMLMAH